MRAWIAIGIRDGLSFRALARRAKVNERTLRKWNGVFRREQAESLQPDRDERAFVELVERGDPNASWIEVVLPGGRRVVIDSSEILGLLVRLLTKAE